MISSVVISARVGIGVLRENPLRTLLSTLGVIIGVASLVAVLALGDGMSEMARAEIERTTGVQMVLLVPKTSEIVDGQSEPRFDYPVFGAADAREAAIAIAGVRAATLYADGHATVDAPATGKRRRASVRATLASATDIADFEFAEGRFFTAAEAARNAPVVVVSHRLARELAAGRPAVTMLGARVRVGGSPREVVGILAPLKREPGYTAIVPSAAAATVFGGTAPPPAIALKARQVEDVNAIARRAEDWLATRYARWERRVTVTTDEQRLAQAQRGIATFRLFMGAITGISLLVGGIGIMNVLLASVTERTREIGIRKATGARRRDILLQFLAESVAIAGAGSAVGIALGVGGAFAITAAIRASTENVLLQAAVSVATVLFAALSAITVGLVFGTYPALRAARLSPIEAMRHE